jgi:hypothetical protein
MTAAAQLLTGLQALGVVLVADGNRLRFHPRDRVTPDLLDRMKLCKGDLLRLLNSPGGVYETPAIPERSRVVCNVDSVDTPQPAPRTQEIDPCGWGEYTTADVRRVIVRADAAVDLEEIAPPEPCLACGSLMAWWDILGGQHCMVCDTAPLARSRRLAARAAELRRRQPVVLTPRAKG